MKAEHGTCYDILQSKGYTHITLGTLDILKPARHLYAKFGFRKQKKNSSMTGTIAGPTHETWEQKLG